MNEEKDLLMAAHCTHEGGICRLTVEIPVVELLVSDTFWQEAARGMTAYIQTAEEVERIESINCEVLGVGARDAALQMVVYLADTSSGNDVHTVNFDIEGTLLGWIDESLPMPQFGLTAEQRAEVQHKKDVFDAMVANVHASFAKTFSRQDQS